MLDMKAFIMAGPLLAAALFVQPLSAQEPADYPSKPIHILVGFTPGGGPDIALEASPRAGIAPKLSVD
jgi:tripartite-type tricarboxylate transporter receptor subunit TctC